MVQPHQGRIQTQIKKSINAMVSSEVSSASNSLDRDYQIGFNLDYRRYIIWLCLHSIQNQRYPDSTATFITRRFYTLHSQFARQNKHYKVYRQSIACMMQCAASGPAVGCGADSVSLMIDKHHGCDLDASCGVTKRTGKLRSNQ